MKYELKIALPMYKIIYSMLFMVIIILVRPIMSYNEIVSVLESSVALLAGVFMADIYYMEYMNERISTYSLFPIKQKRGSILKRAFISQLYLIVLVAVFYWGFVLVYSTHFKTRSGGYWSNPIAAPSIACQKPAMAAYSAA